MPTFSVFSSPNRNQSVAEVKISCHQHSDLLLLYYGFAHEAMLEVPGLPLSPSVIDRQLNPTAKGNNIKMQLIAFFLSCRPFYPMCGVYLKLHAMYEEDYK